jgi:hypothetical protein
MEVPAGAESTRSSLALLYWSKRLAATGSVDKQHSRGSLLLVVEAAASVLVVKRLPSGDCGSQATTAAMRGAAGTGRRAGKPVPPPVPVTAG